MDLIYNCGYHSAMTMRGPITQKKYGFKRRFVTEVNDEDGKSFLAMTYKDIPWCPTNSKLLSPFMKLEDWCAGKEGRFDYKPFKVYEPKEYKNLFKL